MDDYRKYLAQQILTEDKLVTYRLLSRALKVHVNTAKEMLYEFHKWQNDKRPGTLYATYLVYGTQKKPEEADGDVEMTDSQSESGSDDVQTSTLILVTEEQLQEVLKQYEEVTSIHVYSLGPHPLKDLQLLSDTAQSVAEMTVSDESSKLGSIYGMIANPGVRKRERKGGMLKPASATPSVKPEPTPQIKQEAKPVVKEEPEEEKAVSAKEKAPAKAIKAPATKKGAATPSLKRQSSSGISQMFAKAAANPKKPASKTNSSNAPSVAADIPSPALSDDGEDDSEMPDVQPDTATSKARKSRQDHLRRMMEESDEEETDSKSEPPAEESLEEDPSAEPEPPADEGPADEGPAEEVSSTGSGRKRGRRRITKKITKMDDQGYLITIQEPGWESFSEDEEAPPASKPKVETTDKPTPTAKVKKGAVKNQGNIMSFFSKK